MRFAIICSAGGSAFFAAYDILVKTKRYSKDNFIVITDRDCVAETSAAKRNIVFERIDFDSKDSFSQKVANFLIKKHVSISLMLYSRMISRHLFSAIPVLNIHPSILPSYKGINAVGQALDAGAKFLGASIHITTEEMDDGAIIGQVISPVSLDATKLRLDRISFLQKTYLIIMILDCINKSRIQINNGEGINWLEDLKSSYSANPCIQSRDLKELFDSYQKAEDMQGVIQ